MTDVGLPMATRMLATPIYACNASRMRGIRIKKNRSIDSSARCHSRRDRPVIGKPLSTKKSEHAEAAVANLRSAANQPR
ncbi:hypothetical protein AQ611_07935 [Burkholderia singularis]|nr:hypothetical protein AQ611_07935 [Burkholderia sp. Bp7605]